LEENSNFASLIIFLLMLMLRSWMLF
jgi:hypothetical protein